MNSSFGHLRGPDRAASRSRLERRMPPPSPSSANRRIPGGLTAQPCPTNCIPPTAGETLRGRVKTAGPCVQVLPATSRPLRGQVSLSSTPARRSSLNSPTHPAIRGAPSVGPRDLGRPTVPPHALHGRIAKGLSVRSEQGRGVAVLPAIPKVAPSGPLQQATGRCAQSPARTRTYGRGSGGVWPSMRW